MMNEGKKGFKVRHKRKVASIEPTKPRNYVAKNAINSGAGAHKDKKKAMKQGDAKHKKSYAEGMEEKFQAQLNELNQKTKDSYKDKAEKQVKELEAHAKKGEYKDIAKRAIDRRKKGLARVSEGTKGAVAGGVAGAGCRRCRRRGASPGLAAPTPRAGCRRAGAAAAAAPGQRKPSYRRCRAQQAQQAPTPVAVPRPPRCRRPPGPRPAGRSLAAAAA